MKQLITIGFLSFRLALCAQPAANPAHFNHFVFRVPEGWRGAQIADYYVVAPPDLGPGELLTYFLMPPSDAMDFDQVADATIREVALRLGGRPVRDGFGPGPLYVKENSARHAKGWEYSLGHGLAQGVAGKDAVGLDQLVNYYIGVFLVKLNGRMERAVFISKDFRANFQDCRTYLKPAYEPVISHFFFDMEFDDWTDAQSIPGKISHAGISDLWVGLAYFEGSEGSALSEGSMKVTYLAFFDNGQVYYNKELPKKGLRHLDPFAESGHFPRWWGTYTYHDGAGVIRLSYATIPFSIKEGKIYLDIYRSSIPYNRTPVPDGMSLEGSWCEHANGLGNPACIRFSGDGHFSDQGVVSRIEHSVDNCYRSIPGQGQGTYEIRDNSILFRYDNGFTYQAAFSGLNLQKGDRSPHEIHLGFHDDTFIRN
ncbi:MAG: hypothetical protein Q8927_09385 [Bacteroidota bacterium]|nr:hypothetical protein [Bacteroidota bacterium]